MRGRDVHAVSVDAFAIGGDVAQMDPDPELHATLLRKLRVQFPESGLNGNSGLDRVERGRKFCQHVVAGRIDDSPSLRLHGLADPRPRGLK